MTELLILAGVLAAATAFGLWRRSTDGRVRAVPGQRARAEPSRAEPARTGDESEPLRTGDESEPLMKGGEQIEVADHRLTPAADVLGSTQLGQPLGERATLLQFSSAFCSPCRATRVVLADVATMVPGVVHIEVDAESHLELVRQVDVTRTPTVLVLDGTGRIRSRATGAPCKADVIAALGQVV